MFRCVGRLKGRLRARENGDKTSSLTNGEGVSHTTICRILRKTDYTFVVSAHENKSLIRPYRRSPNSSYTRRIEYKTYVSLHTIICEIWPLVCKADDNEDVCWQTHLSDFPSYPPPVSCQLKPRLITYSYT